MSRRFRLFQAIAVLLGVPAASLPALQEMAAAQSKDAISVAIGQSVVPLDRPWKFHVGDSPVDPATHR